MDNETFIKVYDNAIPNLLCDKLIKKFGFEPFKMKKYDSNGVDEFGWHVDVSGTGNNDRFLAFFLYLSKKKEKDGTEVIGNIVHCKNHKSRLTIENKMVDVRLTYDKGLDRHYGLIDLAVKYDIFNLYLLVLSYQMVLNNMVKLL